MNKIETIKSEEFEQVKKLFFSSEKVINFLVCKIDDLVHLLVMTNQRLFLIGKMISPYAKIKQFGLEEIVDIKSEKLGNTLELTFYIFNKSFFKAGYIDIENAKDFVIDLADQRKKWIESL